jgi:hypothetical protein
MATVAAAYNIAARRQSVETTLGFDIAGFFEASPDGVEPAGFTVCAVEHSNHWHPQLLRAPRAATPPRRQAA